MAEEEMVWFRFTAPYDEITDNGRRHVAHAADTTAFVRRSVADDAKKKSRGDITDAPAEKKVDKAGAVIERDVQINDRPNPPPPPPPDTPQP